MTIEPPRREPLFNVPGVVLVLSAAFAAIHVLREYILSNDDRDYFDALFAFVPSRYDSSLLAGGELPGGVGAQVWSFVSYAFIHGSWTHLLVNLVWFLAFGSAVARRFGAMRFLGFFAVTAAAGALAHLLMHGGDDSAVIGASAAISGTMAAAMRFAFQRGGPLGRWRESTDAAYRVPALPLSDLLRDPRIVVFLVVWFGVNLLFGVSSLTIGSGGAPVAWEAHIGGFLAGLLLFSMFDPPQRNTPAHYDAAQDR